MVDSMATSLYTKKHNEVMPENSPRGGDDHELPVVSGGHFHGHHHMDTKETNAGSQLLRYRVVAMVKILSFPSCFFSSSSFIDSIQK